MNTFFGKGNLAAKPTLKHVEVQSTEEPRAVAEMRIYFDHARPDGNGGYKDEGGFWANVTIWGKRAERVATLLPKGARVLVMGTLVKDRWTDKETDEPRECDSILAEDITLDLLRIEEIRLRATKERGDADGSEASSETPVPSAADGESKAGSRGKRRTRQQSLRSANQ